MYGQCVGVCISLFFKQKTAYEMRISDWSSDVCSSDLRRRHTLANRPRARGPPVKQPRAVGPYESCRATNGHLAGSGLDQQRVALAPAGADRRQTETDRKSVG